MANILYVRTADGVLLRFEDVDAVRAWLSAGKIDLDARFLGPDQRWRPLAEMPGIVTDRQAPASAPQAEVRSHEMRGSPAAPEPAWAPEAQPRGNRGVQLARLDEPDRRSPPAPGPDRMPSAGQAARDGDRGRASGLPADDEGPWPAGVDDGEPAGIRAWTVVAAAGLAIAVVAALVFLLRSHDGGAPAEVAAPSSVPRAAAVAPRGATSAAPAAAQAPAAVDAPAAPSAPAATQPSAAVPVAPREPEPPVAVARPTEAPAAPEPAPEPRERPEPVAEAATAGLARPAGSRPAAAPPVTEGQPSPREDDSYAGHMSLGNRLLDSNPEKALTHFSFAASLAPGRAEPLAKMADAEARLGDLTRAAVHYQAALKIHPYGPAMIGLARVHDRMGNRDSARHWYEKYLEINKSGTQAAEARAYLGK